MHRQLDPVAPRRFALAVAALLLVQASLQSLMLPHGLGRFRNVEESYRGFVASELLEHPDRPEQPWTLYVYGGYEAGSLAVSLLATPFVALLGPTVLAVKLTAMTWAAAQLLLAILLCRALFDRRTALLAGLLLALGPPGLALRGTELLGDTIEAQALVFAQWLALWRLRARGGRRLALVTGACAGACVGFSLSTLPAVALLLPAWLLGRLPAARREAPAIAAGVALGLSPVLYNAVVHDVAFWNWHGAPLTRMAGPPSSLGELLAVVASVGGEALADGLAYHHTAPVPGHADALVLAYRVGLGGFVVASVLGAIAGLRAWRGEPGRLPPELLLVAWQAVYLAAYVASPDRKPYWLLQLVTPGAMLVARALLALGRGPALALGATVLALPALAWAVVPRVEGPGPVYDQRVADAARWRGMTLPATRRLRAALAEGRAPALDADTAWGAGHELAGLADGPARAPAIAAGLPDALARRLAEGLGYGLAWSRASDDPRELERIPFRQPHLRRAAYRGWGRCLGEIGHTRLPERPGPRDPLRRALAFGLGYGRGHAWWHAPGASGFDVAPDDWPDVRAGLLRRLHDSYPAPARARVASLPGPDEVPPR